MHLSKKALYIQACRDSNLDLCDTGASREPTELANKLGADNLTIDGDEMMTEYMYFIQ